MQEPEKMNIARYWFQSPETQKNIQSDLEILVLQREARRKHLLIVDGRLIKPGKYPCSCELLEAEHCFEERMRNNDTLTEQDRNARSCHCPCHTYA